MNSKTINRLILLVSIILLAIGLYGIVPHLYGYMQGDSTYQDLAQYASATKAAAPSKESSDATDTGNVDSGTDETLSASPAFTFLDVDFSALSAINADINGWILIDDTKVNYPTVRGTDNDYYLNHMFDHKRNPAGSIFMDYENAADYSDVHSIIYGHHMKNGAMFSDIEKYKSQEFYDSHSEGKLMTPDGNYKIHFISGYVANVMENAWALSFADEDQKQSWLQECISKSDFQSKYTPKEGDRFITLSTCSYVFDDARYVLLGVLEKME